MELRRAGERRSWGGGEGKTSSTRVSGEADGFKVGCFGCWIGGTGAGDGSFKEGNSCDWDGIGFKKTPIGLKHDPRAGDTGVISFWGNADLHGDRNHIGSRVGY